MSLARSNPQTIANTFLCCFKLRQGSRVVACANTVISVLGIWHSLYFGRRCGKLGYVEVTSVHYFWIAISILATLFNVYLFLSLLKENCKAITVWVTWNIIVMILHFTVFVLILALNDNNETVSLSVLFHVLTMFTTVYSIVILLSYNQQITLSKFGYYQRYKYTKSRVNKNKDYTGLDDHCPEDNIEEVFV